MPTFRVIKGSLNHHSEGKLVEITPEHEARGHDIDRLLQLGVIEQDDGAEGEAVEDLDGGQLPSVPYLPPTPESVVTSKARTVRGKPAQATKPKKG